MKLILKWAGIVAGSIVVIVIVAVGALYLFGGTKVNKSYEIEPEIVALPTDAASIERGRHLSEAIAGCSGCHNDDLSGDMFMDEPGVAVIPAPNLTSGAGGIGGSYTDADWIRAVRHGVNPDGDGLLIMPADVFAKMSEPDFAATVAYVKSAEPVNREWPEVDTGMLLGRILAAIGAFGDLMPAESIDHSAPFPTAPAAGPTAEYGRYLLTIGHCRFCHGEDLRGGQPSDPDSPPAPDLTPTGAIGQGTVDGFMSTIRTGVRPGGGLLDNDFMPWESFGKMTDDELTAIWNALQEQ